MLHPPLDRDEDGQQHDRGREHPDRESRAPAVGLRVGEAVDECEQPAGGGKRAGHIDLHGGPLRLVVEQRQRGDGGRHREKQVHVEAPAPAQVLGEHAAEQQADGTAAAGDSAVDSERLSALGGVAEDGAEER